MPEYSSLESALADQFITDIRKNLVHWTVNGQSVFYLTKTYWYQFRPESGRICVFRQSIRTHRIDRGIMNFGNFKIGREWLKEPTQAKKRTNNFFKFLEKKRGESVR